MPFPFYTLLFLPLLSPLNLLETDLFYLDYFGLITDNTFQSMTLITIIHTQLLLACLGNSPCLVFFT